MGLPVFASGGISAYASMSVVLYQGEGSTMDDKVRQGIGAALGRIPSGMFILTACHEERRGGMLCSWVQQLCFEPPMISVAVAKGRPIMPLISESRCFGLCQLSKDDKVVLRKFAGGNNVSEDPFLGFDLLHNTSGIPIFSSAMAYVECELAAHLDVEGDHDLFVGKILAGKANAAEPIVHLRDNGFRY
jgi:flavin reductase (DIM6/NTAB) family NADH-FMN oxidoreductase RutF